MSRVKRYIVAYDTHSEDFIGEIEISLEQFESLRTHLRLPPGDPCFDSYPVRMEIIETIGIDYGKWPLNAELFLETAADNTGG